MDIRYPENMRIHFLKISNEFIKIIELFYNFEIIFIKNTFSSSLMGPSFNILTKIAISSITMVSYISCLLPNPKSLICRRANLLCSCHNAPSVKKMPGIFN